MDRQNYYARKTMAILGFGCAVTSWRYSETDEMISLASAVLKPKLRISEFVHEWTSLTAHLSPPRVVKNLGRMLLPLLA